MGCQNPKTIEDDNEAINENNTKKNTIKEDDLKEEKLEEQILIETYSGLLIHGLNFQNCLIKSQDELINNLRMYIPPKIENKQKKSSVFNLNDKILSNSININFNKNYIIALTGINKIDNVKINNGNYIIYHDGEENSEDRYIALIVKKIEGNPQIIFSPEINYE